MEQDEQFMQMALDYAREHAVGAKGQVGAALVRDDEIISYGASNDELGIHAEQAVLQAAATAAANPTGATMYVTIQPSLYRSDSSVPSDSEVLINAGVRRVVVGSPNKKYSLIESTLFFAENGVGFTIIENRELAEDCLDLFVSTGADQTPRDT